LAGVPSVEASDIRGHRIVRFKAGEVRRLFLPNDSEKAAWQWFARRYGFVNNMLVFMIYLKEYFHLSEMDCQADGLGGP
jgi:hypothetical protein